MAEAGNENGRTAVSQVRTGPGGDGNVTALCPSPGS
jgi:hypothetical protein